MEINLGVIRDKEGIYSALLQSQTLNRQLAVCFNSGGKLLVKICTVASIDKTEWPAHVTLKAQHDSTDSEITIRLDDIQSIYPICDFL